MKQFAEHFYKSASWVKCRNAYMKSKHHLCEECLKNGTIKAAEEVHHIVWLTPDNINDPNITLSEDNLICVCRECHRRLHNKKNNERYRVDEEGFVIPLSSEEVGC